jgi:LPS export ABC transporter protein LptC
MKTTQTSRAAFLVAVQLLLLAGIALFGGCFGEENPTGNEPVSTARRPTEQIFDYQLVETTDGVRQWVLESDQMLKYSAQEDVELVTVKMDFYQDGEHFSVLTADSGRAHLLTNDIHTWGNVVVISEDGRRLETEELFFSNETQRIHNDVFNTLLRERDVVTGIGLETTPDLKYIELKHDVAARVLDREDGGAAGSTPERDAP